MKRLFWISVFVLIWAGWAAAAQPTDVDSLLKVYDKSSGQSKAAVARRIVDFCLADDQLTNVAEMGTDDFSVFYAADRYYISTGNFRAALTYIDKALPLASDHDPALKATMLCDRGYCLFKLSHNSEASKAELEAEAFSKRHQLWQPLARSYNYMAIINHSLGHSDEAKHFVAKALETDSIEAASRQHKGPKPLRAPSSNRLLTNNTHNYLGIACEIYSVAKEPDKAIRYGRQAVEAAQAMGYDAGVVNHLSQLSYAYNRRGDYEEGLRTAQQAVAAVERMPVVDENLLCLSLEYVAFNLLDMKRNAEAVPYIRRAIGLGQKNGYMRSVCYDYKSLAEALEPADPCGALQALRRYSVMMDSLHNEDMHEALGQANAQLHNDELQEENDRRRHQIRAVAGYATAGLLLLLAVIAVLVYINRLRSRTQQETERLQKAREDFFTNVTHEFRTPLTVILGMARQLEGEPAAAIERNGEQLLTLVNQLLDISKVSSATGEQRWRQDDLVVFVGMVVDSFRQPASMGGKTLTFTSGHEHLAVAFVPDYVQKILSNLLSNALKFTPAGGTVSVGLTADDKQIRLRVADTGKGISAEDLPHVFDPFFQGSNNSFTGTGVGLALVKQLAEVLGGSASVESEPGHGSVFTVTMARTEMPHAAPSATTPLVSEEVSPVSGESRIQANSPKAHAAASKEDGLPLILVADDNAEVARYIGSVLADDYEVIYASNGVEALAMAGERVPDMIVTDVMMPDMDGIELCRHIRSSQLTSHIPVVMVTARATADDRMEGIGAGADAYLYKPFRADELLLRVSKLLEQRQLLQRKFSVEMELTPAETARTEDAELSAYERNVSDMNEAFVRQLDDFVLAHMADRGFDTSAVASFLCMSVSQLSRKLKAVIGMTPAAYILDLRLREVKRLIADEPQLTLLDVALRCGFADNAHMTHAFRRKYGVPPSQYAAAGS